MIKLYFTMVSTTHYRHNNNYNNQRFQCYDDGALDTKKTTQSLRLLTYSAI